jgi:hypothetical protein
MSNDANASLAKTFVSFAAASSEAIRALEAELCDVRTQLGHSLEEAANNLEVVRELQYQLEACRNDGLQVSQECDRLQSELDRERDINPQDVVI